MRKKLDKKQKVIGMVVAGGLEDAGGIGRVIGYLLDYWADNPGGPVIRLYDPRGKGSIILFPFFLLRTLVAITWHKATGRLNLLHVNLASFGSTLRKFFIVFWAHFLNIPTIIHLHGASYREFYQKLPAPLKKAVQGMFRRSHRVVVLGKIWKDFLVETIGVAPEKILIIPNGVPQPSVRGKTRKAGQPCRILFLGRLGERKGTPELLEALENIKTLPDWQATLAGDGDVRLYADAAEARGLAGRIAFPGWAGRRQVDELLNQADILVLPSHAENLPISVLEGLAHGIPVVATPVGALPELLESEENALLVPVKNPQKLAEALRRLVNDEKLRDKIGKNGRELFDDKINVRNAANGFAALYKDVLKAD